MQYHEQAPVYMLYGDQSSWPALDSLHCETIASRSRLHDWHIRMHRHAGLYQILFLRHGRAVVHLEDARHHICGPTVVEMPRAFVHGFEFDASCAGYVLTLTYPLLNRLVGQLGSRAAAPQGPVVRAIADAGQASELQAACAHLEVAYRSSALFRQARIEAWMTLIYARLRGDFDASGQTGSSHDRSLMHFTRFNELLEAHYAAHHKVWWYARQLHMTPAHLNLITRKHADCSPLQLIHRRLILEARRHLVFTTMTINEAGFVLGFADPAHFTRFFRRMTGQTPRRFRKSTSPE